MEDAAANQKYRRLTGLALLIGQTALVLPVIVTCLWAMELHHTLLRRSYFREHASPSSARQRGA